MTSVLSFDILHSLFDILRFSFDFLQNDKEFMLCVDSYSAFLYSHSPKAMNSQQHFR